MLIIWGFKTRFKAIAHGFFFCPNCGGDRNYSMKAGKRWFTLFFIPLIPLYKDGGEFVECDTCKSAYQPTVLNQPTTASLGDNLLMAMREALAWMLRESPPAPAAIATAMQALSTFANRPWSEQELQADVYQADLSGLQSRLASLAGALNEQGKEQMLGWATRVAAADGQINAQEQRVLDFVAQNLAMTQAHAYGVIANTTQQAGLQ